MTVAIVDYGSGNLHSAAKALERAALDLDGGPVRVTSDPDVVRRADRVVLPGVGAFADCRRGLDAVTGMEHGESAGLGWIKGDVVRIAPADPTLKIPHMGWNTLALDRPHPLFEGIPTGPDGLHAYFVHSYHMRLADPADRLATTDYGGTVTAAVARGNVAGTQFHPEKSQRLGLALLANFLKWRP